MYEVFVSKLQLSWTDSTQFNYNILTKRYWRNVILVILNNLKFHFIWNLEFVWSNFYIILKYLGEIYYWHFHIKWSSSCILNAWSCWILFWILEPFSWILRKIKCCFPVLSIFINCILKTQNESTASVKHTWQPQDILNPSDCFK